ncbi:exo-alpha-sialidase [Pseudomonas putida]|uniref:exo-alpha-sialidase n=1 Tax=Pseudomonas putida TaxID=303 RepID=UPI0020C296F0|nr:exo-alpha-sialidase [Pseudomonas putida]UTL79540.1 exo-alpha-sialidase [Pseudomonas putida]
MLMHTQQERIGRLSSGEWRRVVARTTTDGGDSWSEPTLIAGQGAGTFPYSTALAVSGGGRCAMAYAIYSAAKKRHQGLTVVFTHDAFQSKTEIPIDLGAEAEADTVPYETRWISDSLLAVSYSQVGTDGKNVLSRIVTVDVDTGRQLQNVPVLPVAVHTYAGGAAIEASGKSLICSPVTGGLVRKYLDSDTVEEIVTAGEYSSPWVFNAGSQNMLVALKNPYVKTTRDFGADVLIMPIHRSSIQV